ncbi:hypothetical protein JD844_011285 [Phrynosoma platyrhinos]|uniref:Beta-2-glycoprotein-1 fifth domain-containing protein n=1 Tax=Phrynosoma platyrhinos TaxID=52577 RepID=A0ABQ7TIS2_PHRPL|nr:hypothetical protein JD844_011285 [Phrynosoma platyrhinos]
MRNKVQDHFGYSVAMSPALLILGTIALAAHTILAALGILFKDLTPASAWQMGNGVQSFLNANIVNSQSFLVIDFNQEANQSSKMKSNLNVYCLMLFLEAKQLSVKLMGNGVQYQNADFCTLVSFDLSTEALLSKHVVYIPLPTAPCAIPVKKATVLYNNQKVKVQDHLKKGIQHAESIWFFCKNKEQRCSYKVPAQCDDGNFTVPACFKGMTKIFLYDK